MSICLCNLSADIALELIAQKKIEINPASPDPSSFTADPTLVDRVLGTFCEKLPRPVELLVGNAKDRRYAPGTCCHVWRGRLPKNGVFALDEGIYVSSPEFTLLQQSNQLHQVNLCQMLGRYLGTWTPMKDQPSGQGERAPLTSFDSLHELSLDMRGARGMGNLKFAMAHTCDRAASPAETSLQLALSLPPELHGLNILQPSMNYQVDLSPKAQRLYPHESIRIDLCWRHKNSVSSSKGRSTAIDLERTMLGGLPHVRSNTNCGLWLMSKLRVRYK